MLDLLSLIVFLYSTACGPYSNYGKIFLFETCKYYTDLIRITSILEKVFPVVLPFQKYLNSLGFLFISLWISY